MELRFPNQFGYTAIYKNLDLKFFTDNLSAPRFWTSILPFQIQIDQITDNTFYFKFRISVLIQGQVIVVPHGRDNSGVYVIEIYMEPNKHIQKFEARIRIRELEDNQIKVGFFVQEFIPRSKVLHRRRFRTMMTIRKSIREAMLN